ncbi:MULTISPECIES: hypothetical protein [unclassified Pseudomonas]|uniref:hypothetical protein n=1 Tax=unclassified Pseudomonas TaxID=196821 RepID=UPI000A1EC9FE|nr:MULTISPECIES: hypothetical protein [unclassified Pseudomonas]
MMLRLDQPFSEQELAQADELELYNVSDKTWPIVLSHCNAVELQLHPLKLTSLEGIAGLTNTRRLKLERAKKIETLAPVFQMKGLTHLTVEECVGLHRLDGIEALSELTELRLTGTLWGGSTPLRLNTLEPLLRLPRLNKLSLANLKLGDDDITGLARCTHLRHLSLTNQFDRAQVAFLASRLNGQLLEPLKAYVTTHIGCATCNGPTAMFTGRRMPFLCSACDAPRFQKLTRQFEQMVIDASLPAMSQSV